MSKEERNRGRPLCGHVLCVLLGMGNDHVYRHRYVPESVLFMSNCPTERGEVKGDQDLNNFLSDPVMGKPASDC